MVIWFIFILSMTVKNWFDCCRKHTRKYTFITYSQLSTRHNISVNFYYNILYIHHATCFINNLNTKKKEAVLDNDSGDFVLWYDLNGNSFSISNGELDFDKQKQEFVYQGISGGKKNLFTERGLSMDSIECALDVYPEIRKRCSI